MAISPKLKKITGSCTQTVVISCLILQNWKKSNATKIFWFKVEGWYFQTPTENVMYFAQPIKARVIGQSLNEFIVMSHYLIPPINRHQLTGLISIHNYNNRLWLANQKPNTNYIISTYNVCNIEIANLSAKNYTSLNVNISASTQFMNLRF